MLGNESEKLREMIQLMEDEGMVGRGHGSESTWESKMGPGTQSKSEFDRYHVKGKE